MPGAELEELVDDSTWRGKVSVKLGAIALTYATTVSVDERDEDRKAVVLKAQAREVRGRGTAAATIRSSITAADVGSHVALVTDLTISGAVAQNARGMIGDIAERLTTEFADCLSARLATVDRTDNEAPVLGAAGKPIGGLRIGLWALTRAVLRLTARARSAFNSLFGRR